jgi:hypothetical protein
MVIMYVWPRPRTLEILAIGGFITAKSTAPAVLSVANFESALNDDAE